MEGLRPIHIFICVLVIIILLVLLIFLVFWFKSNGVTAHRNSLVIDHDGGADDAMAIFMALLNEEYFYGPPVLALTTVHGNVNEPQVFINSQRILDVAKRRDVPIFRGSKDALVIDYETDGYYGYDGLGDNETIQFDPIAANCEHAALALIDLSKKYEGQLTVVALGALTNIALAVKLDGDFMKRLSQLYVGIGNIYSKNHPVAEFNALMDVEAYKIVANNGSPEKLTIIPFSQIKDYVNISNEWRTDILGAIPTKIMQAQNVFEQVSIKKSPTWVLLDPAAMAVALNATSFVTETRYSNNSIILCGEDRGINTNSFSGVQEANAKVVTVVEEDSFKKFLLEIFSAPLA